MLSKYDQAILTAISSSAVTCDKDGNIYKEQCKITQSDHIQGYLTVFLGMNVLAHRVIWMYFNGEIPDGREVNHIDGNKKNNSLCNLEIVTRAENVRHAISLGLINFENVQHNPICGEDNHAAKLTEEDIRLMRHLWDTKEMKQVEIARKFNTSTSNVCGIVNRKKWRHVK